MGKLVSGGELSADDFQGDQKSDGWFNVAVLLAFMLVAGFASFNNHMWRDEVQAFLIARDSATPWELVRNLRFDGHPILWYLLIWPGARLTWDPDSMKPVSWAVSSIGMAVFLWRGPWARVEKLLWPFGYYVLFEYTARSRSYGLGLMLLMIFCALWRSRERHLIWMALVMGLMANVHLYFGVMAAAGGLAILVSRVRSFGWRGVFRNLKIDLFASMVFVTLALFGAYVAAPPSHGDWALSGDAWVLDLGLVRHLVVALAHLAVPFSLLLPMGVPLMVVQLLSMLSTMFTVLVVYNACNVFRHSAAAAAILGFGSCVIIAIFGFAHSPSVYHVGMLLVLLVAGIWVLRTETREIPGVRERLSSVFRAVLVVQATMGGIIVAYTSFVPQAYGRRVAEFISGHGWARDPVAGLGSHLTPVCGYLAAPSCYYMDRMRWSSYMIYDNPIGQQFLSVSQLEPLVARAAGLAPAVTVLIPEPYMNDPEMMARHGFRHVARFSGAAEDNYDIYRKDR